MLNKIVLLFLKSNIECQYSSIAKNPILCSGNKFPILTQCHCEVQCLVPVRIRSPFYLNYNVLALIYTLFQFSLLSDYIITHVSFEALKSGFAVVLMNDANVTWRKEITTGPIKLSAKRTFQ